MKKEANQRGEAMNQESENCSRLYLVNIFAKKEKNPSTEEMEKEKCSKQCVAD